MIPSKISFTKPIGYSTSFLSPVITAAKPVVTGLHPTGGMREVDFPPPGFTRFVWESDVWCHTGYSWQKIDHSGDKLQWRDAVDNSVCDDNADDDYW